MIRCVSAVDKVNMSSDQVPDALYPVPIRRRAALDIW